MGWGHRRRQGFKAGSLLWGTRLRGPHFFGPHCLNARWLGALFRCCHLPRQLGLRQLFR
jgi:hypothetical protein